VWDDAPRMVDVLPSREQARTLVISLAIFWGTWAVSVLSLTHAPVLSTAAALVGLGSGLVFWLTFYWKWRPALGSAWQVTFDLFRPRWIGHTLGVTGWNPRVIGYGLLALLVTDSIIGVTILPRALAGQP